MPMDDYDTTVSKFDYTIDVYQNDNIQTIISDFLNKVSTFKQSEIQFKQDEYLTENITNTVNKLRNALEILESRTVTNIGGKVAYHVIPEKYDPDIGYSPKWILVQVHRGYTTF